MKKIAIIIGLLLVVGIAPARAHAHLERSDPPANASLTAAPEAVRLWFTEPLEPAFSRITLLDGQGNLIPTAPAEVAPDDAYQLTLPLDALPDGLYTVAWRVISSADGHSTAGSFAFGINVAVAAGSAQTGIDETITPESITVRWFNLLAASLVIGGLGFWLFVWQPGQAVSLTLTIMIRLGWLLLGISSALLLMLQTSVTADIPFWSTPMHPAMGDLLTRTTYGSLWIARIVLWGLLGAALVWRRGGAWLPLVLGAALLLTQSLFGHASATQDAAAAIAADWLHLLATALWVGGLIAFLLALITGRAQAGFAAELSARFSNYARVAVGLLIVTGSYAAWLHIGSVEALLGTRYGQALVIKLVLFAPLLAVAAVNLFWTQRRLRAGRTIWVGRLRGLIGAEIVLLGGVLVAAAALTSGSPARTVQALWATTPPQAAPISEMGLSAGQMVHLDITPGYAGENTFVVTPYDRAGDPIEDASLIRLRFDNLDRDIGQSELRPEPVGGGIYRASGANLSIPGRWRIRMTVQRPGEFDTVIDFTVQTPAQPAPPPPDTRIPLLERMLAGILTGIGLLGVGGFALAAGRMTGARTLGAAALLVGLVVLLHVSRAAA